MDVDIVSDAVSNGKYHIKVIMFYFTLDFSGTFGLNYPEVPDSCLFFKFLVIINIEDMLINSFCSDLLELGKAFLRHPDRFVLKTDIYFSVAFFGLEYKDFTDTVQPICAIHSYSSSKVIRILDSNNSHNSLITLFN